MSGKNEVPLSVVFKDGIDFPSCEYCNRFNYWECYGAIDIIFFNPKNFVEKNKPYYNHVAIYCDEEGRDIVNALGRVPELTELSKIDKISCNGCRESPSDFLTSSLMSLAIEYVIWTREMEKRENVRKR